MNTLDLIKMMTSNLKHLDVNLQEVKVKDAGSGRGTPKNCFNNAYLRRQGDDLYVLGYLLHSTGDQHIPIEHAWIKRGDEYIDVTIKVREEDSYVSVVELTYEDIEGYVGQYGHAPDLYSINRFVGDKKV